MQAPAAWITYLSNQASQAPTDTERERFLVAFLATLWTSWEHFKTSENCPEADLRAKLYSLYIRGWEEASVWNMRFFGQRLHRDDILDQVLDDMDKEIEKLQRSERNPGHLESSDTEI